MKKLLEIFAILDALSLLGGLLWLLMNGSLPSEITELWNAAQTAMLIILCIAAIPVLVMFALIVQSQLQAPYEK